MTRTLYRAKQETDVGEQGSPTLCRSLVSRAINLSIWQPLRRLHTNSSLDSPTLEGLLQVSFDTRSDDDPFSVTIPQECFLTLLQTHPVRHAKACAGYLKDRIRATLHESHIYLDDVRVEEYQHLFKTVFFPRLLVITERIAVAKDGALPALDLCVYIKLDCLHGYFPFFCDAAHQRANCQIDSILKSILQPTKTNRLKPVRKLRKAHSIQDDDAQARQPDAAYLCQSIRRFRAQYDFCDHAFTSDVYPQRKRGCASVNTAVAFDLLQRHAYTETKLNVYRVVGKKLPRELADIVLKYTLHGRGQPEEPGIFDRSGKAVIECGEASVRISRAELLSC